MALSYEEWATAKKKLAALAKPAAPKRRLLGWARVLGGAVVIMAVVGMLLATDVIQWPGQQTAAPAPTAGPTSQPTAIPTRAATQMATAHPGEAYYNQGVSLLDQGNFEEAIAQFDQALALGWETAELYYSRGWACYQWPYSEGGCSYEQAIANLTKAIELDPQNANYWEWRGGRYLDQGNYQAAIRDCDEAIELDPQHLWAHITRGQSYEQLGNGAQALSDFNKAVELAPNDSNPYYHRGLYYRAHGQWEGLVADMTKGMLLNPDWPDWYGHRGYAYVQLGRVAEARADYEKFLELTEGSPTDAPVRTDMQQWLEEHPE